MAELDASAELDERQRETLLAVYAVVAERRVSQAELTWQVPTMSFAGQAFLLGLALNGGGTPFTQALAGALSLVVAVMSLQVFLKHQYLERMDSARLRQIERWLGVEAVLGHLPHGAGHRERADAPPRALTRLRATQGWAVVQVAMVLGALFVVVTAWLAPDLLRSH